jgi:hypothetical protein
MRKNFNSDVVVPRRIVSRIQSYVGLIMSYNSGAIFKATTGLCIFKGKIFFFSSEKYSSLIQRKRIYIFVNSAVVSQGCQMVYFQTKK